MLSNALVGLSGGLICQSQKYADIGMGTGAIVIGLAAHRYRRGARSPHPRQAHGIQEPPGFRRRRLCGVLPHPRHRAADGHGRNDMKLLSAVIVALQLCVPVVWEKFKLRASYSKGGEADA